MISWFFLKEGPHYDHFIHNIPVNDMFAFNKGDNILRTGKTPKYHEQLVHGVEIQCPSFWGKSKKNYSKKVIWN